MRGTGGEETVWAEKEEKDEALALLGGERLKTRWTDEADAACGTAVGGSTFCFLAHTFFVYFSQGPLLVFLWVRWGGLGGTEHTFLLSF